MIYVAAHGAKSVTYEYRSWFWKRATLECFKSPPVARRAAAESWIIPLVRREENSRLSFSLTKHLTVNAVVIPLRYVTGRVSCSLSLSLSLCISISISLARPLARDHAKTSQRCDGGTSEEISERASLLITETPDGSLCYGTPRTRTRYGIAGGLRNTVTSLARPFRQGIYPGWRPRARRSRRPL